MALHFFVIFSHVEVTRFLAHFHEDCLEYFMFSVLLPVLVLVSSINASTLLYVCRLYLRYTSNTIL